MKKRGLYLLLAMLIVLTLLSGYFLYNRLVMPYNSEGNYFDETSAIDYHQHALIVYGIIASFL